jgi:choline dehydrogenase-like flavoprotein
VLLLDAGPDYPVLGELPYDLVNSHRNSTVDHDWGFDYQPTERGRGQPFPRGRVTGGSSAVNTTIALRGMPEDYDGWAAAGNTEWAWEKVLPAFKRLERDLDYGNEPYHGDAGPISIRRYRYDELTAVHQAWLEASRELGYPDCPDANDPESSGSGPHPMNKLGRLRISTAIGYLAPARARPNLTIRGNTLTRRLLIEGSRVTGVEVEGPEGEVEAIRGRLVVLSAGALQSPAVLIRSGIGPRRQLESLGVEVVRDVPAVGAKLSDHPALAILCRAKDPSLIDEDQPIVQTILRYTAPESPHRNDLQIEAFSYSARGGPVNAFAIAAVLEQVEGTGTVALESADPHAKPVVQQHFLEDERDMRRLVECFKDTLAYTKTRAMREVIAEVMFPDARRALDDEGIADLLHRLAASGFHPCATVRMGPAGDPDAVVDQYGRAHMVEGLVVADASIMPTVPRANTNLTSIMIGEMVGEWVRTRPGWYGL